MPEETKRYQVIYADPPWQYRFSKSKTREIENHYPTMSLEEIKAIEIPSADNSVLYLWGTAPKLLEAVETMRAWGFEYKSQMVWDKVNVGMGYWFRGQHEYLLVGVKGKFSPPSQKLRVSSVLTEKRSKHSKKPLVVKSWIESWYPNESKLEMFSRQKTDGWDVWGNEVESDIELCQMS